jgi:hypothetical protein
VTEGLDQLKERVALDVFGDASLGRRLRGGNAEQLRADALELARAARQAGGLGFDIGGSPSPEQALSAFRRRVAARNQRLLR